MATRKKKKAAKKKAVVKRRVIVRRRVVVVAAKRRGKSNPITRAKKTIREHAEKRLREGLFKRDQAKTSKQHKAAVKMILQARRELRRIQ